MKKTIYEYSVIVNDIAYTIIADVIEFGEGIVVLYCEDVCVFSTTEHFTIHNKKKWK